MKVYIACAVGRISDYNRVRAALEAAGHTITFPWADTCLGPLTGDDKATEHEHLAERARLDINGVTDADCVVALLPARLGTHSEIGASLAVNHPVIIHAETEDEIWHPNGGYTCAFYHHELVRWRIMPFDKFVSQVARMCEMSVAVATNQAIFAKAEERVAMTNDLTLEQCIEELERMGCTRIMVSGENTTIREYAGTAHIGDLRSLVHDYRVLTAISEDSD